ncbi:MAG TPA: LacI family DNA-binding transcriptional regulator [Sediminibacterium sp.]|nr:LacI family DNA-binding transcriptional regulator [Sediminibacterium sp.]
MPRVTIRELAKQLGLSTAAVSKALRDSHEISNATKERVRELAQRLHFVPNAYAGSLRRKQSGNIALVLPEVADSFFSQVINGIESIAEEKGYHVLIYLTHEKLAKEQAILSNLLNGRVDGVLISVSEETTDTSHLQWLADAGIPLVFFDRIGSNIPAAKITTNDRESACLATETLLQKGCRRIALLSVSTELSITRERIAGFREALDTQTVSSGVVLDCGRQAECYTEKIRALLEAHDRPDGIIASVEKLAAPVYTACRECALKIPEEVQLICFSNIGTADFFSPSLSTISQPAFDMGREAARTLFGILDKKIKDPQGIARVLPSAFICRGSTR